MIRLGSASQAARFAIFVASHSVRSMALRAGSALVGGWPARGSGAERLLLVPCDLRPGDPKVASAIYAGSFSFGGQTVRPGARSPFEIPPPSPDWAAALHGFGWLRHLAALNTPLARANARALALDWAACARPGRGPAWTPHVTARRILSWTAHAPFILKGADSETCRAFIRSLSQQAGMLRRMRESQDGWPRLLACLAVVQADLSLAGHGGRLSASVRPLAAELERQILPDGGHISRHPGVLTEALLDLLPVREAFEARGSTPPQALLNAIDRMMPMLRFFRLGADGFARFNGMGATCQAGLAAVLAFDDISGGPLRNAPHSGYQRMDAGDTSLIVDSGSPPPPPVSREAHAGCLSFELASGGALLVVNCGAPRDADPDWRGAARMTAAHSTLMINDRSSCRFMPAGALAKWVGTPMAAGPRRVLVERREEPLASILSLTHDGYEASFGLLHRRIMTLTRDGSTLDGEDAVEGRGQRGDRYTARFHLHPSVQVERGRDGARLRLANGRTWDFLSDSAFRVEDSVYLAGGGEPEWTLQIVIEGVVAERPVIRWRFAKR